MSFDLLPLRQMRDDLRKALERVADAHVALGAQISGLRENVKGVELAIAELERRTSTKPKSSQSRGNWREALFYWAIFIVIDGDLSLSAAAQDVEDQLTAMTTSHGRTREGGVYSIGDLREGFKDSEGVFWDADGSGFSLRPASGRVMAAYQAKITGIPAALSAGIPAESGGSD